MSSTTANPPAASLRRVPSQTRSRAKVEAVLDAANEVLARDGAGALTTKRVAEVAGVSVGTVYQYFADKEALAEALALRYFGELHELMSELADRVEDEPFDDPAGAVLDEYAAAYRERPGFTALWWSGLRTERLRDATRPGRQVVASHLVRLLAAQGAVDDPDRLASTARMSVLIADGILREAFRLTPTRDRELLEEGTRVLRAYLAAELGVERD